MKSLGAKDIAEFVGIAAIVASLIFVGFQLKQSKDIALSEALQARSDASTNMLIASAENPYFVSALGKSSPGNQEPITPSESVALHQYATAILYSFHNSFEQYSNGFSVEQGWQSSRNRLKYFLNVKSPLPVREVYLNQPDFFTPRFQSVVNEIILEIDAEETLN